jgi:hypothetical protein
VKKNQRPQVPAAAAGGFSLSDKPVVGEEQPGSPPKADHLPPEASDDLLYAVARDPGSLFVYWDLQWARLFSRAGISARQVHLRTYRGDGSVESTQEINPFRGHCYADVSAPGTEYYCELGSFEGAEWKALVRSSIADTPEANMSEGFSGELASVPAHLSFQRLLDVIGATADLDRATLARSVANLQETARLLKTSAVPGDWSQLVTQIAGQLNGGGQAQNGATADLSTLVEMALGQPVQAAPSQEEIARWKDLVRRHGGSSWSGASHSGFGGSDPA